MSTPPETAPTLRTFQDVRDTAADTIRRVKARDLTADQARSITALLSLAADTVVKEETLNRALVRNTADVPGVPATAAPPPRASKNTEGTFILNLNVNGGASPTVTVDHVETPPPARPEPPAPEPAPARLEPPLAIEVWDEETSIHEPEPEPDTRADLDMLARGQMLAQSRVDENKVTTQTRSTMLTRLMQQRNSMLGGSR